VSEHPSLETVQRQLAPTLTELVIKHLGAKNPVEQLWLKEEVAKLEWKWKMRDFRPEVFKAIDF
jgi:hypothetical protein